MLTSDHTRFNARAINGRISLFARTGIARVLDSTVTRSLSMKETKRRHRQHRQSETRQASKASAMAPVTRSTRRGRARRSDTPTRMFTAQGTADHIDPSLGPITPTTRRRSLPSTPDRTRRGPILRSRSR